MLVIEFEHFDMNLKNRNIWLHYRPLAYDVAPGIRSGLFKSGSAKPWVNVKFLSKLSSSLLIVFRDIS